MTRSRAFLCALLVALSVVATVPATAQEDFVTLNVTVETASGDPVRGATVAAAWDGGSTSRTTAANGKAYVDVPDDADVEITVDHDDYVKNYPVEVEDASDDDDVSVTVYEKATARIIVHDGDARIADAEVTFRKSGRDVVQERTDGNGVVDSGTIEEGTYTVTVRKAGYYVAEDRVRIEGDDEEAMAIQRGTVTLEVNVTDDHFDPPRPVGGATVEVGGSGSVTTQPGGIGRISVPVNAWARLDVSRDGYQPNDVSVFVREEDKTVDLSIQRTPSISVELLSERVVVGESASLTVTDEYGDPVEGATVRVDGETAAETDANGQAVVRVESGGNHTVTAETDSLEATAHVRGVGEDGGTVEGADTEATDGAVETVAETPGFGVGAALVALLLATVVGLARRDGRA